MDNSGKFSPRIVESEGGYFALRNNTPVGERDREPASPRIITSSTTLAAAGSSRTVITRDCGWGEMITGIESEGVETSHHHQYFLHRRTPSGTHESPEELLLRLKSKTSASNLTLQQIHQTAPTQRPSSSLSLSFTPTSSTAESLSTASISRKTAKTTAPHPNSKTSSRSPLRLRLPPPPRVQIDALGIGVPHIIFPHHPYHRLFPNTPDGRFYERRRESAPGLLVPGIHPRSGDWLLTPPEEVGGMLWHCPTPSDHIENIMADTQEELEGDDAKCVKHASRPATSDGTLSRTKDTALRREVVFGHGNVIKEEEIDARTAEEAEESTNFWVDDNWGAGEEWLRGAAEVLCRFSFFLFSSTCIIMVSLIPSSVCSLTCPRDSGSCPHSIVYSTLPIAIITRPIVRFCWCSYHGHPPREASGFCKGSSCSCCHCRPATFTSNHRSL